MQDNPLDITDETALAEKKRKNMSRITTEVIDENFEKLRNEFYHLNLKLCLNEFINNCDICNKEKYDRNLVKQQFKLTETRSFLNTSRQLKFRAGHG